MGRHIVWPPGLALEEKAFWLHFIYELGGVAGITRAIVAHWRGPFTTTDILAAFHRRYPSVDLPPGQLEDCIESLCRSGQIVCLVEDANGRIFRQRAGAQFLKSYGTNNIPTNCNRGLPRGRLKH